MAEAISLTESLIKLQQIVARLNLKFKGNTFKFAVTDNEALYLEYTVERADNTPDLRQSIEDELEYIFGENNPIQLIPIIGRGL